MSKLDLQLAKTLFNPMRVRILSQLGGGPVSTDQLAAQLDENLSRVSYHTAMLTKTGCIRLAETRWRRGGVERFYELAPRSSAAGQRPHLSWLPVVLDERGWDQVGAIIDDALDRISEANEASAKRIAAVKGRSSISATVALASFIVP